MKEKRKVKNEIDSSSACIRDISFPDFMNI